MTTKSLPAYPRPISPDQLLEFGSHRTILFFLLAFLVAFVPGVGARAQTLMTLPLAQQAAPEAIPAPSPKTSAASRQIDALAGFLARKYRVSQDATRYLVGTAFAKGTRLGVDPLLILAVMGVESGLNPFAESLYGAKGLMQVIPRYHAEKFDAPGDAKSVLDPDINIQIGARILKEYIERGGSLVAGLQLYNGAPRDESNAYANKVLGEQQRLQQVVRRRTTHPSVVIRRQ